MERCPRCGTRADAVPVTHHVPPGKKRVLAEHLDVVRRELGLGSDGEALAAAVRLAALDLNQGGRIGSAHAGHTARAIRPRRKDVGEHQDEQAQPADGEQQEGQDAQQQQDDGGATPDEQAAAEPSEPGATDAVDGGAGTEIDTGGGDAVVNEGGDAQPDAAE